MIQIPIILLFITVSKISSEIIQIVEEPKNNTEVEGLTKYLKTVVLQPSNPVRIIEDHKLYHCLYIDPVSHAVMVKNRIDREVLCPQQDKCVVSIKFLISPSYQSIHLNVEIIDLNDNAPSWPEKSKTVTFIEFEGNKFESRYIQIDKASDPDTNENGQINYLLKEKDGVTDNKHFKIKFDVSNSRRIELAPKIVIDREKTDYYEMLLIAEDNGIPRLTGSLEIIVHVTDKNDNGPIFERPHYRNDGLSEKVSTGFLVLTVSASDADAGNNGRITYRIDDQKASEYFFIDENGSLLVKKSINYDAGIKNFQFSVLAIDGAPEEYRKTGECEVVINVKDENDEKPEILIHVTKRDPLTNEPAIIENEVTPNFVLAHVEVKDPDFGGTDRVSCTLNNNPKMRLEQIASSGNEFQIIAGGSFDREERSMEKADITCTDQARNTASKSIAFQILDLNDNSPKFTRIFHFRVVENSTNPVVYVGEIMAVDKDAESNSKIEFQIMGDEDQIFRIDASGKMFTKKILDREEREKYNLTILAKDGGVPPRTGTGLVMIDVTDINDWKPEFNSSLYEFSISENATIGSVVGLVVATDKDLPDNTFMKYGIVPEMNSKYMTLPFQINRNSQQIVTKYLLNREEQSIFMLTVIAIDNGQPVSFTSTTTVKVTVLDVNDNIPIFKTNNKTVFVVQMTDPVGHEIGTVEATDLDSGENSEIIYQIKDGNNHNYFTFDTLSGKINLSTQLIKQGEHRLIIIACDRGKPQLCSRYLWVTIRVVKPQNVVSYEAPIQDPVTDSKTYFFIICVLVILLFFIVTLIICAIIFKNRLCYPAAHGNQNGTGYMNSMEINGDKSNNKMQKNTNVMSPTEPYMSQQRPLFQPPNCDLPPRERQISSDYQSLEGGSPPYKQGQQFSWDNLQPPFTDNGQEPLYAGHRSTKDYYYPSPTHQYPQPAVSLNYPGQSQSYIIRMNHIPKESQFNQETFPRSQSPKRYNSLQNFHSMNAPNSENFIYKSLRKEKNKATFV